MSDRITIEDLLNIIREDVRREERERASQRRSDIAKLVWQRKKAAGWKPKPRVKK